MAATIPVSHFSAAAGLNLPPLPHDEEPAVVLAAIDAVIFAFADDILRDRPAGSFHMVSRRRNNVHHHPVTGVLRLGSRTQARAFKARSALSTSRLLCVLATVHALLRSDRRVSQRQLFYMLINSFANQVELNATVLDASALLNVPRYALNIGAATRGVLAGCVTVALATSLSKVDCQYVGTNGWPIPGDVRVASSMVVSSTARYILIIEKFGIFTQLVQDRLFDKIPCILLCGKGYPSIATRAMAWLLEKRLRIPVLGLADFNPHGIALLQCYKYGSVRSSIEGCEYTCNVHWLGLRSHHINAHANIGLNGERLTVQDKRIVRGLLKNGHRSGTLLRNELEAMTVLGKHELQWLYGTPQGIEYLVNGFVDRAILQGDYISFEE